MPLPTPAGTASIMSSGEQRLALAAAHARGPEITQFSLLGGISETSQLLFSFFFQIASSTYVTHCCRGFPSHDGRDTQHLLSQVNLSSGGRWPVYTVLGAEDDFFVFLLFSLLHLGKSAFNVILHAFFSPS